MIEPTSWLAVAGTFHDASWLHELESSGVQHLVYQNIDPQAPWYFEPYANEAGAYFLFILNYYHCLPQVSVFDFCQTYAILTCAILRAPEAA